MTGFLKRVAERIFRSDTSRAENDRAALDESRDVNLKARQQAAVARNVAARVERVNRHNHFTESLEAACGGLPRKGHS